uniref:Uncharacterized protein n=1 Tax=Medicago truncatula TaxID=3880 RepID=Q1S5I2_MEDTR|nr:hypothetical protein MtrDRAFT_AC147431g62v2 [Medicago truncatula]
MSFNSNRSQPFEQKIQQRGNTSQNSLPPFLSKPRQLCHTSSPSHKKQPVMFLSKQQNSAQLSSINTTNNHQQRGGENS